MFVADFVPLQFAPMNDSESYKNTLRTCFVPACGNTTQHNSPSSDVVRRTRNIVAAGIKEKSAVVTKPLLTESEHSITAVPPVDAFL